MPYDEIELEHIPWSELGPSFIKAWGYPDGKFDPEHLEIIGPSGSGKTFFEATILQERVAARNSGVVFIATKPADKTILQLGWPIVSSWEEVQAHRQCIFWPKTKLQGSKREQYLAGKIEELLARLWTEGSNNIIVFDEIATSEGLSPEMKKMIAMYWREGRSMGITIVAMKQRPQGVQRDMHSETVWTVLFAPKDADDAERYAQLMGDKRGYIPILASLDRNKHEFILKHARTGEAVISWIDTPLVPQKVTSGPYNRRSGKEK